VETVFDSRLSVLQDGDQELSIEKYIEMVLPDDWQRMLTLRNSAAIFVENLPRLFRKHEAAVSLSKAQRLWELVGLYYMGQNRPHEALAVFSGLYDYVIEAQEALKVHFHKGMPLVWISECYTLMDCPALAKRYLMLTLVEDAIREKGVVSPEASGVYFRLVWLKGLSDIHLREYALKMFRLNQESPELGNFPEWVLQNIDQDWMIEVPSARELSIYPTNRHYVKYLMNLLGDGAGKNLEILAEYLLSCMAGCRTSRRLRSGSSEYDIVCSIGGYDVDFRSELGRYFVCECKDWQDPADFTTMAKFCRILDSIRCRFGILFSKSGLSGSGQLRYAELEQQNIFHDRGIVVLVVDNNTIDRIAKGDNFISLLRSQYEKVRLNLQVANT